MIFRFDNLYKLQLMVSLDLLNLEKEVRVNMKIVRFIATAWLAVVVTGVSGPVKAENLIKPTRSDDGLYHHLVL